MTQAVERSDEADEPRADTARAAGRGGLAVLGAKLFFLVTGFLQQPLLRLAVGLSDFGGLAQALVVANTVNNVVVATGTQGVSRVIAGAPAREHEALRTALRIHAPASLLVAAAMAAGAPLYARFEHADDVVMPLRILALVALLYGLYAPLIGYLNGRRWFGRQAGLDVAFATLRTVGLIAFGRAFARRELSGVVGATLGWVAAAAVILPLAVRVAGLGRRVGPRIPTPRPPRAAASPSEASIGPPPSAYLAMLLPIAGVQLCTNALLQVDIALLGRFLGESAPAAATTAAEIARGGEVKGWVAIYKECQTFAFLPYQLLFSVTLVLFPMLARAQAEGDRAAVRAYVARGARLAAIFGGALVGVIVAMPESLLSFAYGPADARRGADVLRTMAFAQGAFAMLGIATTVLTSIGRERAAAWITFGALVAVAAACAVLVPGAPFGHAQLTESAAATALALAGALGVGGWIVRVRTGAFVPGATALRVGLAVASCAVVGVWMPRVSRLATPAIAALVLALYFVALAFTREIGAGDVALVRTLVKRRA